MKAWELDRRVGDARAVAKPPVITYSIVTLIVLIIITVLIIIAYRKNRNKR
jgi:t-SNARE complex subunit (syntaxin)